ncbi:hypothetical protein LY15_000382 [Prauserella flava]|nr:hypothetical protein [Prauserella flava]MCR3732991.1 hypothetical protein [Prauserella salsuginis]
MSAITRPLPFCLYPVPPVSPPTAAAPADAGPAHAQSRQIS